MTLKDVKKAVAYWLTLADKDWQVAHNLSKTGNHAHALFFLHLSLEKLLKAIIVKRSHDHAPYGHNLLYLFGKTGIDAPAQVIQKLEVITSFNMEARYPDENLDFYRKANAKFANKWLKDAAGLRKWLKQELSAR